MGAPLVNPKATSPLAFAVIAAALATVIFASVQSWLSVQEAFHRLDAADIPLLARASEVSNGIASTRSELFRYIHNYEPSPYRVRKLLDRIERDLQWVGEQGFSDDGKELASVLSVRIFQFREMLARLESQLKNTDTVQASLTANRLMGASTALTSLSGKLKSVLWDGVIAENEAAQQRLLRNNAILAGVSLAAIFMLVCGILFYNRFLKNQVRARTVELEQRLVDLDESRRALAESEARFRELADLLPQTVFEADETGRIIYANQSALRVFGYADAEMPSDMKLTEMLVPEQRSKAVARIARLMAGERFAPEEYTALRRDGTTFPAMISSTPIRRGNRTTGLCGIAIDITQRKQEEADREALRTRLAQARKMESIGRLAGGIAHDLNNLLSPIIGYGEMLLEDLAPGDERRKGAEEILNGGFRARDLVRQLLAFGRQQTLSVRPVDMNRIIDGFRTLLRRAIREDIALEVVPGADIEPVMADAGQIEQVILNLAVNGADAMPEGGTLTIETAMAEIGAHDAATRPGAAPGRYVLLTVRDSGTGMDAETLENIFEPFFSTKGERGTGLGLATVYGIVKQHGGNVYAESEPGQGATFRVYLPAIEAEVAEDRSASENGSSPTSRGAERILLVEDNPQVRALTHSILERRGYAVMTAESGEAALAVLSSCDGPVHLLMTDVVMPGMNGRELFEAALGIRPGIKVLFMSGYTKDVIAHHGVLDEGVRFIQKPFTVRDLADKVREVLEAN